MTEVVEQFYNDKQIADLLAVSVSWVRLQRFNRRHGHPHVFDIDHIQLGSVPRYKRSDVESFMARVANG